VSDRSQAEAALVAGLKAGDPSAFDAVYDAYRPRVFGFLVRLTRDRALAEDLLQETFLRLVRNARRLESGTRLKAWLLTVARNLFVSHRRWRVLDLSRLASLSQSPPPAPQTPFEQVAGSEREAAVERAIGALSVPEREVILLVCVEGLSPAEAASVIGVSASAARQRLHRARARLRAALEETK